MFYFKTKISWFQSCPIYKSKMPSKLVQSDDSLLQSNLWRLQKHEEPIKCRFLRSFLNSPPSSKIAQSKNRWLEDSSSYLTIWWLTHLDTRCKIIFRLPPKKIRQNLMTKNPHRITQTGEEIVIETFTTWCRLVRAKKLPDTMQSVMLERLPVGQNIKAWWS